MTLTPKAKHACYITLLCSLTYLAVYFAKNVLSAVSPQMIEDGISTQSQIGTCSSVYFVCYAVGQLVNGMVGDRVKARYMICFGVLFAGVSNLCFLSFVGVPAAAQVAYGLTGFFLSMIFGPLTKLVAENTDPRYTPRCNMGYTFAAYLGSPLAGLTASFFDWKTAFSISVVSLLFMGSLCYIIFLAFERRGIIQYGRFSRTEHNKTQRNPVESVKVLLKHRIAKFALVAVITGVVRTAVVFWMPTYIAQNLGFSPERAASVFTVATLVLSLNTFVAVFVYEKLKRNMDITIFLAFSVATVFFLAVFSVKHPVLNIMFLIFAVLSSNCASSILWARYCPSLRETGLVSTAAGFLDFVSYMSASAASKVFANAVPVLGWGRLVLVWCGLMLIGAVVCFPYASMRNRR